MTCERELHRPSFWRWLVLGSTLVGGWLFAIICTLIAMIVWAEWFDVVSPNGDDRVRLLGFFFLGLLFVAGLIVPNGTMPSIWALATIAFAAASVSMAGGKWSVAGFVYSGLALVALNMLRHSGTNASGLVAILFLFAVVWATDIGAYFAGRSFRRTENCPGYLAEENLVRRVRRCRIGDRRGPGGVFVRGPGRLWSRRCACDRPVGNFAGRGFLRIVGQSGAMA
jgi:4-amino-4-deoxy-L-arabinose transferase-like glycosyltransferase